MSYEIYPDMEKVVSHQWGVKRSIIEVTKERAANAEVLLTIARATTTHVKFDDEHDHETQISTSFGGVDGFINMDGTQHTSAKSIEFGHNPSGVFGPGGMYGDRPSKPPEGLYILHRAAGLL